MGDRWDIMTSITFSCNVEILTLELWELFKETNHKSSHGLSNLIFVGIKIGITSGFRETCSNWLINVKKISIVVPRIWVRLKSFSIFVELIWSVFIEKSNLGRASWSTSEPKNDWIIFGAISGFKPPVEHIISAILIEVNDS
jgi:hypothetical protein